jgi:hypothetical protein
MPEHRTPGRWRGPISRRMSSKVSQPRWCIGCGQPLTPEGRQAGDLWCWSCKDSDGYALRLQRAQREAARRCAERYPPHQVTQGDLFT